MSRNLLTENSADPVATGRSPVPEHLQALLAALRGSHSQPVSDEAYAAGMAFLRTYYGASRRPEDPVIAYNTHRESISIEFGDWGDSISGSVQVTSDGRYIVCFSNRDDWETRRSRTVTFTEPAPAAAHVVGKRAANRHIGLTAQPQPLSNITTNDRSK